MADFFIRRPIVAIVIAILFVLIGGATLLGLPIESYPDLAPPMVVVEATYPGAGAETVEQSVATPIEQQMSGVDDSIYMKSTNTSDGRMGLEVSFEVGTDLNTNNVLVQNRFSQAQSRLPESVVKQGVTIKKKQPSILMLVSLYAPEGAFDSLFLNNYAMINVRDSLLRVPGVAEVQLIGGAEYGMRVWVRPDKLAKLGLTVGDVTAAIREQNIQAPAGQIGSPPSPPGQEFTYTVAAPGRLSTPEEFERIIVRQTETGAAVRVADVARVELGGEFYKSFGRLDGGPAAVLSVYLLPGANLLAASKGIYAALDAQRDFFPDGVDYAITYDVTPAVEASIEGIVHTLLEAVVLVILVVFVFLQSARATLIPLLTVPVSIVGTFIFFPLLGFSVNTLTLFGLVLAIGIVVDDAIVVVEAVMHHIEHGKSPREATLAAMKEVSGPVVGIALVLTAVFVPVAFLGGLTGRLYQQFALTIAVAVLISAFSALSLSPALAAMLLKAPSKQKSLLQRAFGGFNRAFDATTRGYVKISGLLVRRAFLSLVVLAVAVFGTGRLAARIPSGFVPGEDQGILLLNLKLPAAASLERTDAVCRRIEAILAATPGVHRYNTLGGFSFLTGTFGSNLGAFAVRLAPWDERATPELHLSGILKRLQRELAAIPEAIAFPFAPPTITAFGASGGFNFMLQDRSGTFSVQQLSGHVQEFLAAARARPELQNLYTAFDADVPQLDVDLDREKARKLGVPIDEVFSTLQAVLGGAYVNDFNRFGRLYRVFVQSEAEFRQEPRDIGAFYVRSRTTNEMVPLGTLVSVTPISGAELTTRFNLLRSVEITGSAAPGFSSGQANSALEEAARTVLPPEMGFAYAGLSYQEKVAPPATPTFVAAVLFVFLLLAALYESWRLPWSVLLATPLVVLGSFFGVWLSGFENNVFVQVGLIMLIGLAAKNSILIVEFAKLQHEQGKGLIEAALEGARLRFRPILMTAFAFILGVVPLMLATGAGAASRQVMGTAVFWGMLVATALGVFLTPAFFVLVESLGRGKSDTAPKPASPSDGNH